MTTQKITLSDLKAANSTYFSKGNKRFFGDCSYKIMHVKGLPFLLTYTAGFSDMFGNEKSYFYTAKPINTDTLKIGYMVERNGESRFKQKEDLKEYLQLLIVTNHNFFS